MSKEDEERELQIELAALTIIVEALEPLPAEARWRVLNWIKSKYRLN